MLCVYYIIQYMYNVYNIDIIDKIVLNKYFVTD